MVLAHVERLRFGKEVAYTYGPLGFLVTPLAISPSSLAAAICYAALGGFSLACATIVACSRRFGSTIGVVAASVLMVTAPLEIFAPELYSLGLILLACLVAQRELHLPRVPFIAVIGVGAALQTLIKPTAGALAVVALVVAIVSTSGPRMRGLGAGAAGYLVGILGLWLIAGQRPEDIFDWARLTLGFSAGYAGAMMGEEGGRLFEYLAAAVLIAAVVVYAFRNTASVPDRRSSVLRLVMLVAAYWVVAKEGFIRHDLHSTIAFFGIAIIGLAIAPQVQRPRLLGGILAASVVMTSIATVAPLSATLDPTASVRSFFSALTLVARTSERVRVNTAADAQAREEYQVPSEALAQIGNSGVHVDPAETSLVHAYSLVWRPAPVFQRFQAYTERADALNAGVLSTPRGPSWILREAVPAADGRNDLWDSPRYVLRLICAYGQSSTNGRWQLLKRKDDRCGAEAVLGRVTAGAGEEVRVPSPGSEDSIVAVRIHTQLSIFDRILGAVFKPRHAFMLAADGVAYRVAQGPDSGPLVVRVPQTIGWDAAFGGATAYRSLSSNRPATFEFVEIPVRQAE